MLWIVCFLLQNPSKTNMVTTYDIPDSDKISPNFINWMKNLKKETTKCNPCIVGCSPVYHWHNHWSGHYRLRTFESVHRNPNEWFHPMMPYSLCYQARNSPLTSLAVCKRSMMNPGNNNHWSGHYRLRTFESVHRNPNEWYCWLSWPVHAWRLIW